MSIDIAIIRIPPVEEGTNPWFAQIEIVDRKCTDSIRPFTILEGDSYSNIKWSNIVLAQQDGEGSIDLAWFDAGKDCIVWDLGSEEGFEIINRAIEMWYEKNPVN